MTWFDPLNNSGGVSFDFFDFTYLSIPPIRELFQLTASEITDLRSQASSPKVRSQRWFLVPLMRILE